MSEKRPRRSSSSNLGRNVRLMSVCPVCRSSYHVTDARLLQEGENGNLVHVQCGKCHSALLVLVVSDPHGVSALSVLTDFSEEEVENFRLHSRVTADDVLAFHTLLQTPDALWT